MGIRCCALCEMMTKPVSRASVRLSAQPLSQLVGLVFGLISNLLRINTSIISVARLLTLKHKSRPYLLLRGHTKRRLQ
jgi:hypothetical protein